MKNAELERIRLANERIWNLKPDSTEKKKDRYSPYKYIYAAGIKKLVKANGKECSREFLREIDLIMYEKILIACRKFNTPLDILDAVIAKLLFR